MEEDEKWRKKGIEKGDTRKDVWCVCNGGMYYTLYVGIHKQTLLSDDGG